MHGVAWAIERRVCSIIARSKEYHTELLVTCFCKSLGQPLLAVGKICFEKFSGLDMSRESAKSCFCFKSGKTCEEGSIFVRYICDKFQLNPKSDLNSPCTQFSNNVVVSKSALYSY